MAIRESCKQIFSIQSCLRYLSLVSLASFHALYADSEGHGRTMESSPVFEGLKKKAIEDTESVIKNQPRACQAIESISGKSVGFIRDHYINLATDFVKLVPRDYDSTFGALEIYDHATKNLSAETMKKIAAKLPSILTELRSNPSKEFSWNLYVEKFGGDPKTAMLSLLATEQFVLGSKVQRDLYNTNKEYRSIIDLGNSPEYKEYDAFYARYVSHATQLNVQGKLSNEDLGVARSAFDPANVNEEVKNLDDKICKGIFTETETVRFNDLRKKFLPRETRGLEIIAELEKEMEKSAILDEQGQMMTSSGPLLPRMGVRTDGKSYKASAGIDFAWALSEKGYSANDILFTVSQGSLAYEATDILYDHFGKTSGKISTEVENDKNKIDSEAYDKVLQQLRLNLKSDPNFFKSLTSSIFSLPQTQTLVPHAGTELFDDEYFLTLGLLAQLKHDPKNFESFVVPVMKKIMGSDAYQRTIALFKDSINDVELAELGASFFLEHSKGILPTDIPQKWDGIFTPSNIKTLNKACNVAEFAETAKRGFWGPNPRFRQFLKRFPEILAGQSRSILGEKFETYDLVLENFCEDKKIVLGFNDQPREVRKVVVSQPIMAPSMPYMSPYSIREETVKAMVYAESHFSDTKDCEQKFASLKRQIDSNKKVVFIPQPNTHFWLTSVK